MSQNQLRKERIELLDKIGFLWDPVEQQWQEKYQELMRYVKDNGDANVPANHPLRKWIGSQRTTKKSGKISETRIQLLDSIGFIWDPMARIWQEKFYELKQYHNANGSVNVIANHPTLGAWINVQRKLKKKGKLSEEYVQLLNSVGFTWDPLEQAWNQTYQQFKQYLNQNCGTYLPEKNSKFSDWIGAQRYNKKKGKLPEHRIKLLDEIGFNWDPYENEWQEKYNLLKQYVKENGDAKVLRSHPILGTWVGNQRRIYKSKKMANERIKLLDAVGFIWDASNN